MKKLLVLFGCLVLMSQFTACVLPGDAASENPRFPRFLVGVWKADQYDWAFKFERDGTISRLVHMLAGPVKMEEGIVDMEGPDPNTFAYFIIGDCPVKYDHASRRLSVIVSLDGFHMRLPIGDLEGNAVDYFDGPVSRDGKTWTVSWREYSWLEGAESTPDPNLIEAQPEKLVFTKTKLIKPKHKH